MARKYNETDDKIQISFNISKPLNETVRVISDYLGISKSEFMRMAIIDYICRNEKVLKKLLEALDNLKK